MQQIYILKNDKDRKYLGFFHCLEDPKKNKIVNIMKLPTYDFITEVQSKSLIKAPEHLIVAARLRGEI